MKIEEMQVLSVRSFDCNDSIDDIDKFIEIDQTTITNKIMIYSCETAMIRETVRGMLERSDKLNESKTFYVTTWEDVEDALVHIRQMKGVSDNG